MFKYRSCLLFFLSMSLFNCAQPQISDEDLIGEWTGKLTETYDLKLDITIELKGEEAIFRLSRKKDLIVEKFKFDNKIKLDLDDDITFSGIVNKNKSTINGFIGLQRNLYPIKLSREGNHYTGELSFMMLHHLNPKNIRLSIEEVNDNGYTIYPMLGSFWVNDFKQEKNKISFKDYPTGFEFEGQIMPLEMVFDVGIAGNFIAEVILKKNEMERKQNLNTVDNEIKINDGWELSENRLDLPQMQTDIQRDSLVGVEGVLIARNGKILYEKYFAGFDVNTTHNTRSASKSISSAIIGIAIDNNIIESVDEKLYDFIPYDYQYTKDSLKAKITIKHLLTMSSGLDVNNKAYEGYYQNESDDPWLKTVLEAPMVHEPGTYTDYGSANPFLLGIYLHNRLDIPLEFYMHEKLFSPLGITNYVMNTDDTGIIPYFGGGLSLTPRDMLKFGQLYLNEGTWNGEQIISKSWIQESFKKHTKLQDFQDKDEYGYFWYHHTYMVDGKSIKSIEARGAGGQFIFVVPELEVVAVITAGNYRNGKTNQSLEIFRDYVLPALLK
ncbi:serine hydrolase domain-containing protein [Algoriphagus chordae]|uniref:CubicO group peptidase (Beta-lactamase class C family) n=1 Tax=Algoriphagus chordae TaxID=237019 RepID=A0A2W7QD94_9BACT|nr:serine hydrolase [Algoriphagus chordae]PZX46508.1 CubicO group peptidase (beta-lactamase class C family) [Algoriphagus chordae]